MQKFDEMVTRLPLAGLDGAAGWAGSDIRPHYARFAQWLARQSAELGQKMLELEQRAFAEAGQPFNLGSPKQIGDILFQQRGLPVLKKTPTGAPSTDEETLALLAQDHPLARAILDYRGMAKLKSTYTDKLPQMIDATTGRVHTSYSQSTAVTDCDSSFAGSRAAIVQWVQTTETGEELDHNLVCPAWRTRAAELLELG